MDKIKIIIFKIRRCDTAVCVVCMGEIKITFIVIDD